LLAASGLIVPGSAFAQSQPVAPTREEITRATPPSVQHPRAQLEVEGGIERAPCALDNPEFRDIRFTLRNVEFDGLSEMRPEALVDAYAPLVGREHPVSIICEVRDRAATILRQAGYIASVEVPEQRIADGVVRFRVLMARLVDVRVRGDAAGAERPLANYLGKLKKQPVFNRYEAERYLLLANDLPGYNVRLTLRPAGTRPGEVIGDVTVLRAPPLVDANVQNYGSRDLGRWGGLLRAQVFGLMGLGDHTTAAVFTTSDLKEQQTVQLGHSMRLGPEGLTATGAFTYAWAKPSVDGDSDVRARTMLATAEVGYPFVLRQSHSIRGSLGLDIINQDVEIDEIDLTRDRLRVAFLRLTADAAADDRSLTSRALAEPAWRLSGLVELRRGLDIFGATEPCGENGADCLGEGEVPPSRVEGDATATVLRGNIYGEFRPAPPITLALGARAQLASQPLMSFEEFSAGNYTVGRGYDPGSLLGDRGIGVQAEIRAGSAVQTSSRPATEGYAFFDYARVSNRDRLFVDNSSRDLSSVGAGVRLSFDRFRLDTALAVPLQRVGLLDRKPDPRLLFSLTTRLWPWSYR
jgi:hemolysin activation/secretion protein